MLGLVNRAITPQFSGLTEILEDLICAQTLFCFILQNHKLVSGQCTLVLQPSQLGLNVENGRSVHGNAGLIQKREWSAAALSRYFYYKKVMGFSFENKWQKNICLSSYVCTILCNNNVELPYCFRKTFAVTPSVVAVVSWRLGLRPATGKGKLPKT